MSVKRFRRCVRFTLLALVWVSCAMAPPAKAYTVEPPPPWEICGADSQAALAVLEYRLAPPDGSTVLAGSPVTVMGGTEAPVSFALSSSPGLDLGGLLDEGPGSASPQAEPGLQPIYTYSFSSTKATATPGTVYWRASFSNATLTPCVGLPASVLQTSIRRLIVLPAPAPAPQPETPSPIPPVQLGVSIESGGGPPHGHRVVTYRVRCTASCQGDTYFQAVAVGRHARHRRVAGLDFGPVPVSMPGATGGSELFVHRFRGRSLRVLDRLLHAGGALEIRVTAKVVSASGDDAVVHGSARLHL